MTEEVHRTLGNHDAQLKAQEKDIEEMKASLRQMADSLRVIEAKFNEISGGKKAITMLVAVAATAGGFLHWLASAVLGRGTGVP